MNVHLHFIILVRLLRLQNNIYRVQLSFSDKGDGRYQYQMSDLSPPDNAAAAVWRLTVCTA